MRSAEDVSVSEISRMASLISRAYLAVSKRSKIRMLQNVTIENRVRFWLQKSLSIGEQELTDRGNLQKKASCNDY